MRVARGVQNKVLEAMAMARPVLVSTPGLEGINVETGEEVLVADSTEEFIEKTRRVFEQKTDGLGAAARARVCRDFSWDDNLPRVGELLEQGLTDK